MGSTIIIGAGEKKKQIMEQDKPCEACEGVLDFCDIGIFLFKFSNIGSMQFPLEIVLTNDGLQGATVC